MSEKQSIFECDMCGQCCRNLNLSDMYADLDRGDGTCRYLKGNLCSIYDERPTKCKIDKCYDLLFKSILSKKEYYKINYDVCKKLKERR